MIVNSVLNTKMFLGPTHATSVHAIFSESETQAAAVDQNSDQRQRHSAAKFVAPSPMSFYKRVLIEMRHTIR